MSRNKIIVVDDNPVTLAICDKVLGMSFEVFAVESAIKMFEIIDEVMPSLIVLDVEMPGMDGYEAIKTLKANDVYKDIAVVFLSALDDAKSEMAGLDLGAVDYIHKPFDGQILLRRVEKHIKVIEGRHELLELNKLIDELSRHKSKNSKELIDHLLAREEILTRMAHDIRSPLNTIMDMIATAINTNNVDEIINCLGKADIESRLILEIIDDVLDIE
ncbi:MAG: response regulator [Oscillospiraceae bacterium]|nr:response regulator [Oscillospiraceae bacterium]